MSFRSLITHNFWLKLFSLLMAGLIWSVIWYERKREGEIRRPLLVSPLENRALKVRVSVTAEPGDARVFQVEPEEIDVIVIGESAVLKQLSPRDVQASVDLRNVTARGSFQELVRVTVPETVILQRTIPLAVNVEQVSP